MFKDLFSKQPVPDWLQPYFDAKQTMFSKDTLLKDLRFVVLDTETTGLDIKKDNLLSIGAVVIENQEIIINQSLESIVYNDEKVYNDAILIHGILPTDSSEGKQAKVALEEFINFLDNSVIVAHHTGFDMAMLTRAIQVFYPAFKLYNYDIDTARMAMKIDGVSPYKDVIDRKKYTLDALCERYDVEVVERHTAWGDAYSTALLFLKLANILEDQSINKLSHFMPRRRGLF
ncbi:MAG: PolC-type DNA polymerase III [Saprospiraceae bacterium]